MSQELQIVPVQIEIPYGNNVKYEIDHKTGQLICDRFLHGPFAYPFNYYSKYAREVGDNLPQSTVNKIIMNGDETEKWTNGLYDCLDIIDL